LVPPAGEKLFAGRRGAEKCAKWNPVAGTLRKPFETTPLYVIGTGVRLRF